MAAQEMQWHLFGCIIFFSLAAGLKNKDHVCVDIFSSKLSKKIQKIIFISFILLFLIPGCALISYYSYNYAIASLDFPNSTRSLNHYTQNWFTEGGFFYSIVAPAEAFLRENVLLGESSSDPGGLEARYLIKMVVPIGTALLLLQGVSEIFKELGWHK